MIWQLSFHPQANVFCYDHFMCYTAAESESQSLSRASEIHREIRTMFVICYKLSNLEIQAIFRYPP